MTYKSNHIYLFYRSIGNHMYLYKYPFIFRVDLVFLLMQDGVILIMLIYFRTMEITKTTTGEYNVAAISIISLMVGWKDIPVCQ